MSRLIAHSARPPHSVSRVQIRWRFLRTQELLLRWRIDGAQHVVLPPEAIPNRADDLWKTTCFELFVDLGEGAYREFNFSPSGQWAVYDFASYRKLAGNPDIQEPPVVKVERGNEIVTGAVRVPVAALAGGRRAMLSTVIEEVGGEISFWANSHQDEAPDFHNLSCFPIDLRQPE